MNAQQEEARQELQRISLYDLRISLYDLRISRYNRQLQELDQYDGRLDPARMEHYRQIYQDGIRDLTEEKNAIIRKIMKLPDQLVNLLLMIHVKGLKIVEVAAVMDQQQSSISRKYSKALQEYGKISSEALPEQEPSKV